MHGISTSWKFDQSNVITMTILVHSHKIIPLHICTLGLALSINCTIDLWMDIFFLFSNQQIWHTIVDVLTLNFVNCST